MLVNTGNVFIDKVQVAVLSEQKPQNRTDCSTSLLETSCKVLSVIDPNNCDAKHVFQGLSQINALFPFQHFDSLRHQTLKFIIF